ncbi:MAG: mechanosensitive ion channel [Trichodesmium sp. St16_bin4-tuft]|nr:mechanosensitive ion channel [Trichodesmium sp. St4_bin8_1]MDE5074493.1 mechanosensitive ion channel [Trichodesmium sp. St5_bin8]MDE5077666.1 mechanosensitive ion channel [Trichodesmium sp. St2_bin6]MDE5100022.1 mechanosensitive ion channel [Trichodesmium sp. St16_bin4-tuft]MDE5103603.1 mechanosensitive ion channel [Trichodesmium sp. St19_bin2]
MENVDKSYQIYTVAVAQYLKEPGLLPSALVRDQFEQGTEVIFKAGDCLDLSKIPPQLKPYKKYESTLLLKEILDRIEVPPYAEIPDTEYVRSNTKYKKWRLSNTRIEIIKVDSGPQKGEFLFSPYTVANLDKFYQQVKNLPYKTVATEGFYETYQKISGQMWEIKFFSGSLSWLNDITYWEQTLWQWIGLVISLIITLLIPCLSFWWNWGRVKTLKIQYKTWELVQAPLIVIISLGWLLYSKDFLNITGDLLMIILFISATISWIMIALTIFLFGNALGETIIASPEMRYQSLNEIMIRKICRLLSFTVATTILIIGLNNIGISLVPFVAGLGIGGFAIALAAKPTLENLIAGVTLLADQPVKVGEYCSFGNEQGNILEIGLYSTRILSLNGDLISIPNSKFLQLELVNKSRRDHILLHQTIGLHYNTTSEQLQFVLAKIREMILAHPKLLEETARVRFIKYGNDYARDVEIFIHVETGQLIEFLAIQEDVLLRVNDIVESSGTCFAVPYFESDKILRDLE